MAVKRIDVNLKLKSTHRIVDGQNRIVMAEGRMTLLEAIVSTGSINQAAKLMGMSYKSAWSKIRSTEAHFKTKIVHSNKSMGTRLTQEGRVLLDKYKQMKLQCLQADDDIFDAHFKSNGMGSCAGPVANPPIVSFVGHSGSGKTTFIERLIPALAQEGIKVAIIKHDVHGFEMDKPGKDTWRHKQAGAVATIISSSDKIGMVIDAAHDHRPEELAPLLGSADLIITEGYKRGGHPKIEIFRPEATGDEHPLSQDDPQSIALISDQAVNTDRPVFGTHEFEAVALFVKSHFNLAAEG